MVTWQRLCIIPSGFSTTLLADQPVLLDVIVDKSKPAGETASRAIETVTGRLMGAVEAAHISASINPEINLSESLAAAITSWEEPALTVKVEKAVGKASQDAQAKSASGYAQASAGMMVQFSIFGLITSAMVLVLERKSGTLQRLLSSPIRKYEVIAGHVLAMFSIVFTQQLILVLVGQFVFGVDYMRQPFAILLMVIVLSLWASSLGLFIGAISRKEDQVITLSLVAMFIFAALGGAWFPLEVAGKAFASDWSRNANRLGNGWVPKYLDAWIGISSLCSCQPGFYCCMHLHSLDWQLDGFVSNNQVIT